MTSPRKVNMQEARRLDNLADQREREVFALNREALKAVAAGDLPRMARESDEALRTARAADRYRDQAAELRSH